MSDLIERLRAMPLSVCQEAADEIERLQTIIDGRPAINAGLPETYINWSQQIAALEIMRAVGVKAN